MQAHSPPQLAMVHAHMSDFSIMYVGWGFTKQSDMFYRENINLNRYWMIFIDDDDNQ